MSNAKPEFRLLFFHAEWCGVCHEKTPVVDGIARDAGLPLEVLDWDTEDGQAKATGLRIQTVPTLALVDGERVRFRLVGRMITPETATHLLGMYRPASAGANPAAPEQVQPSHGGGGDVPR